MTVITQFSPQAYNSMMLCFQWWIDPPECPRAQLHQGTYVHETSVQFHTKQMYWVLCSLCPAPKTGRRATPLIPWWQVDLFSGVCSQGISILWMATWWLIGAFTAAMPQRYSGHFHFGHCSARPDSLHTKIFWLENRMMCSIFYSSTLGMYHQTVYMLWVALDKDKEVHPFMSRAKNNANTCLKGFTC